MQDTVNPTAVGQRRNIASHTAGPSAVYTVSSNWPVQLSASAVFVIENNGDRILLWPPRARTRTRTTSARTPGIQLRSASARPRWAPDACHARPFSCVDLFDTGGGATGLCTGTLAYCASAACCSRQHYDYARSVYRQWPFCIHQLQERSALPEVRRKEPRHQPRLLPAVPAGNGGRRRAHGDSDARGWHDQARLHSIAAHGWC